MDSVDRVHFGRGEIGNDVDAVEEVAGQFFEILDLADLVHLIDDSIDDGLDFFVGFLLEERALAFQPRFVPQELLFVKRGDVSFSAFGRYCHEGRNISLR